MNFVWVVTYTEFTEELFLTYVNKLQYSIRDDVGLKDVDKSRWKWQNFYSLISFYRHVFCFWVWRDLFDLGSINEQHILWKN